MNYARVLNQTLHAIVARDDRVVVLGEDIIDPYGGAFKVTKGLSTAFPDRVLTTPVSEAAIVGVAGGLALAGRRPVVEIMFGDFVTLCFDQVLNHVVKFPAMYDGRATCPVIIRTPMGGGRAYGPTHSQSLEKHYLGVPGLTVAAASLFQHPLPLFESFLAGDAPVLFVEHKIIYAHETRFPEEGRCGILEAEVWSEPNALPTVVLRAVARADCKATVIAYGHAATLAVQAAELLAVEREIFIEVVVPAQLSPISWTPLLDSAEVTGRVVICEEGTAGWGWGTELSAQLNSRMFGRLKAPVVLLGSDPAAIPSARTQEGKMLFNRDKLLTAISAFGL